jgi:3-deoxy-D-manno-octulosonic-acid transferase
LPGNSRAEASFFLPLDFSGLPRRVIGALNPALLAVVETELWPNLLHESRASGLPVLLVNGRLSADRMSRYRRFAGLYRPLLAGLAGIGAQSTEDAERFVELGVSEDAIRVTGNVKYDLPIPEVDREALMSELGIAPQRPVLVAGSTGEDEEAPVLEAFMSARAEHPRLFLVLAPRHPERCDDVERLIRNKGLRHERISRLEGPLEDETDLLLVDTLGQLARLYGAATLAFVGGSLVPIGGHNVLEPAALGIPVLFGPHTQHFAAPAKALSEAGGAWRVEDGNGLARALIELLGDEESRARAARRAHRVVARNQGAMERTLDLLLPLLDAEASGRPPGTK